MKIATALKKVKNGGTISSLKAKMLEQDLSTLVFWLLEDTASNMDDKHEELNKMLLANDWEVDRVKKTNM